MSESQDTPAPPPSEETDLRLRAKPPRVVRLSRKALTIIGATVGVVLGGVVIYALQPPSPQAERELHVAEGRAGADALADAPRDYSQVPPLGPPLPGDLGRPMLDAQARGENVAVPPIGANASGGEVDRGAQEQDAARTSQLFLAASSARRNESTQSAVNAINPLALLQTPAALADGAAQGARTDFLNREPDRRTVSAERIEPPASPYVIQAGSVIPAALIAGIRSDLPGQITAQVTQNVYDSPTRRFLLIPQGSRLIGMYESEVSFGQERVLLGWDRLIFPGGESIVLERQPGADAAGFGGLQDRVDHHWGNVARAALISTLLGIGAELGRDDEDDIARALRRGAQDTVNQAGQQVVQRELGLRPTLTISTWPSASNCRHARHRAHPASGAMTKLKLGPLLDDKSVKLTIELPAGVHRDLLAYGAALAAETGDPAPKAEKLIAPMLERFMATDRAFRARRKR